MSEGAALTARHMWRALGFAPTDAMSGEEWTIFCDVHDRGIAWMHANSITPSNARRSLHYIHEYARQAGDSLYANMREGLARSEGIAWTLTSPSACHAYVSATLLATLGSMASQQATEHAAAERVAAQRPHWQQGRSRPDSRGARDARDARGSRGGRGSRGVRSTHYNEPRLTRVATQSATQSTTQSATPDAETCGRE